MKNDKRSLNRPKMTLERLYIIDRQIASGKYPNTNELAKAVIRQLRLDGLSISTISRDIEFMKWQLDAPIEYDALNRGYFYTKKYFRLPAGFAGEENMLALGMAKNILSLYRGTPLYEASVNLLESIVAPLASDGNRDWLDNRIVVPTVASAKVEPDIWNNVVASLKENRIITFEYQAAYDDEYKLRRVRPYQLLFDNGLWYLYCHAEDRKEIRIFSLGRMKNILLTKDRFTLPPDYEYQNSNSGSYFGVFSRQEKYSFKIAFYEYAIAVIKDRKWAEDQKIVNTEDCIEITFTSTQYEKVLEWVLSRGCYAQPLEPEALVNDWSYNIKEMQKMVRKKVT